MRNVLLRYESCLIRGTSTSRGLPLESAWTWVSMLTAGSWRILQITVSFGERNSQFTYVCDFREVFVFSEITNWSKVLFLLFVLSFWCNSFKLCGWDWQTRCENSHSSHKFLYFCWSSCDTTNHKGTNLFTCIWNTTVWTAMTGCWGWCAVV